ncbi:MAG: NosD domain-containing protein, partial [Promethearchaeota archaeon]
MNNTNNGTIIYNNVSNNNYGLFLLQSNNISIISNKINYNYYGISFFYGDNNYLIKNNTIRNSTYYGIEINSLGGSYSTQNLTFTGNRLYNSGIVFSDLWEPNELEDLLSYNISKTNKINDKTIYYYVNCTKLNPLNFSSAGAIYLFYCNDTFVSNQNIARTDAGIKLYRCINVTVSNTNISRCRKYGIFQDESSNLNMVNNRIKHCKYGIKLSYHCYNGTIINNTIEKCKFGIDIYESNNNTLNRNKMVNCGVRFWGTEVNKLLNNVSTLNTVNGKPLYYYKNKNNLVPSNFSNAGEIILVNCANSSISNLSLSKAGIGIALHYSKNITISHNSLKYNNVSGIYLDDSDDNTFFSNIIAGSKQYGVCIISAASNNNLFYNNMFANNSRKHVSNYGNNQFDNGTLGNYWDDYNGKDANDDGIGDDPYTNIKGGKDNFPIWWDAPVIQIASPDNY